MDKKKKQPDRIRILAPAGSMEALTAAVRAGADEVYLGPTRSAPGHRPGILTAKN